MARPADSTRDDAQSTDDASASDEGNTLRRVGNTLTTTLDHVTDVTAIAVLGYVAIHSPDPKATVIAAITSVALGKRYMAQKP